jgi:hypothetical protein
MRGGRNHGRSRLALLGAASTPSSACRGVGLFGKRAISSTLLPLTRLTLSQAVNSMTLSWKGRRYALGALGKYLFRSTYLRKLVGRIVDREVDFSVTFVRRPEGN